MKKEYLAEFIGTFFLVFIGTGSVAIGTITGNGQLGIALAFGLTITLMAYTIGGISGAHLNPAVTISMWLSERIKVADMIGYIISQILGAIAASGMLSLLLSLADLPKDQFGQNGFGPLTAGGAFIVELLLSFLFIFVILMVTSKFGNSQLAGVVIGLTLTMLILVGLNLTGVSVNPARSIGPAIFAGGEALSELWVFILAPIAGGILASVVTRFAFGSEEKAA